MCVFETGVGWPYHRHDGQDEWVYVIDGQLELMIDKKRIRLSTGASIFIPRKVAHGWTPAEGEPVRILNMYQPAGKTEEFFQELFRISKGIPRREQVINKTYTQQQIDELHQLFDAHGIDLLAPLLLAE